MKDIDGREMTHDEQIFYLRQHGFQLIRESERLLKLIDDVNRIADPRTGHHDNAIAVLCGRLEQIKRMTAEPMRGAE